VEKAQVTIEFMIILVVLFGILLSSIAIFGEKNEGFILSREQLEADRVADKIARTVNAVFLAGNGTEAKIVLERDFNYEITIEGNAVHVNWRNNFSDASLDTNYVTIISATPGNQVNVKNSAGVVTIENS